MSQRIQLKRDTAANWTTANTVLRSGEMGLETNTLKAKFGDGVTGWNALNYAFGGASGGDMLKSDNLSGLANNATARGNIGAAGGTGTANGTNTGDQTVANTADATSHTVTLSSTGGSVKLVEGANITLTTTGTGADGILTIASTSGGGDMVLASTQTVSGLKTFLSGMFGLRNVANTFSGFFSNTNTADRTYTLQDSSDTLVGRATTDVLTNKDISSSTNTYRASSLTVVGGVELATTAEINTGTDTTRAMPVDQYVASNRNVRYFDIYAIEKVTDNAVGTNIAGSIECPFTGTITEIGAYVETAGVTGASVWDVNKNGTTIMTTNKLSIDTAEVSTRTAATAPTLTTTAITAGDLITIDTDSLSTTKPKGFHLRIGIRLT